MEIAVFEVNPFSQNTYLVYSKESKQAILIDAGFYTSSEKAAFKEFLEQHELTLEALFLTHAHLDHIFSLNWIAKEFSIPVFLHAEDHILLKQAPQQASLFGFSLEPVVANVQFLEPQLNFSFKNFTFDILFTPGHAPGHVSFYFREEKTVIAGDTLFAGSIGRTDLYKGDFNQLSNSIKTELYSLPDETQVLSGHGSKTTIKREKLSNPYVNMR